jgi:hypothetical protein
MQQYATNVHIGGDGPGTPHPARLFECRGHRDGDPRRRSR